METFEWYQQPSGHWHQSNQPWGTQEKCVAHWSGLVAWKKQKQQSSNYHILEKAKATIFKFLQQEQSGGDMKSLKFEKKISKVSKILQFSPFLDEEGLIRAKGRIGKIQLDFNAKHPILMLWKHHAVESFLRNEHKDNQHEGTEKHCSTEDVDPGHTKNLENNQDKCVTCRKGRAQSIAPVMADLPEEQLDASTAFSNDGVDYLGPFIVKIGRRNEKRWCCLFTYLTMRAVHIEVVPKLDTDSCLNAIMRFIARRGKPRSGKTLLELKKNCRVRCGMEQRRNRRTSNSTRNQMKVHPTRSTSLWRSVGAVGDKLRESNEAMYAGFGNRSVIEDVFSTAMCIVEQTLNTRQLTPVSSDVNGLEALTPNHFLLCNRNVCLPYLRCAKEFVNHRKLFRHTQAYQILYGTDFVKNICQMAIYGERNPYRRRSRWLIEDSNKRGYYNLGRVTETFDESDGVIRSAIVRMNDAVYKKPVVKLAPVLPGRDVFAMENRAGDVVVELTNVTTKLNSSSKPF